MSPNDRRLQPHDWIRFLLLHATVGAVLGVFVGGGILITDAFGVGTLFWQSEVHWVAGTLYFLSFASTFAAASTATAIMNLSKDHR